MKILEFIFKSEEHKVRTIKFNYANQDLTETSAKALMERISALEMFQKDGVKLYAAPVSARYLDNKNYPIFDDSKKVA
ncbi:DUF2922 domain-containing protein [Fructilactobacillus sanfranciscensis]|uniref:DUF2922 domain-containing protein n=1 Tax=Fructilactobacillus sanfranciscensis TaxID=1625 RepID=UPI00375634EB